MESKFEKLVTHTHKPGMITYLKVHPDEFKDLVKLSCIDKQPYSWRASWLLWSCMEKNDRRVKPYVGKMIDRLSDMKDNQQRELMMILQRMELNVKDSVRLFDSSIKIWGSLDKQPSVRFNAFRLMIKLSKNHPELRNEVIAFTDSYYTQSLSPGVRHSVTKLMSGIQSKASTK